MRRDFHRHIDRRGWRIGHRQRLGRWACGLRNARFQNRHRALDQTEDQPFGDEGAAKHQRQLPGDVEQLAVGGGIVGRADEPPVERLEVRQRARDIGDLARDFTDLIRHGHKELCAEAVVGERDRGLLFRRARRRLRWRRDVGNRPQILDHLRALLVVLERVERPPCLIRRQRLGLVRGGRWSSALGDGGRGEECKGEQDRADELLRHEGLFESVTSNTGTGVALRHVERAVSPPSCVGSLPTWRLCFGNLPDARAAC